MIRLDRRFANDYRTLLLSYYQLEVGSVPGTPNNGRCAGPKPTLAYNTSTGSLGY